MDRKIDVLDHGFVRLADSMGNDLSVIRSARVSYNAEWRTGEDEGKDDKLIHYLWRNNHVSPFESVTFTFDIKAPIFVIRQWQRHKWSFNEVSARYSELPEEFYVPALEQITTQSTSNKQMRTDEVNPYAEVIKQDIEMANRVSFSYYRKLLAYGCPRELARSVLPLGTYSHMFGTCNLRSLLHFIAARTHEHAQYEVRVYAEAMLELIKPIVPISVAAFKEYGV